jgi:hypothetical protein
LEIHVLWVEVASTAKHKEISWLRRECQWTFRTEFGDNRRGLVPFLKDAKRVKKAFLTKYYLLGGGGGKCTCLLSGLCGEVAAHVVGLIPWKTVKVL